MIAAFITEEYTSPQLIVDGGDYSGGYEMCLERTSYVEPVSVGDPGREWEVKQKVVDSSNRWAACAQENGYPGIKDASAPVVDDDRTYPIVLLPDSVTMEQRESLARDRPVLDQAEVDRILDSLRAGEPVEREP